MLPRISDFIKNPQQAVTDMDTFGAAAEAITQPLIAYEKAISSIYDARLHLSYSKPVAKILAMVGAVDLLTMAASFVTRRSVPSIKSVAELGFSFSPLAHVFMSYRGIRANSATTRTLRALHPDMNRQFDVIENVFRTWPTVNRKDVPRALERARKMRDYARQLGYSLEKSAPR